MKKPESKEKKLIQTPVTWKLWLYGDTKKRGHLGEKVGYRRVQDWGISLTVDLFKSVSLQGQICQHIKHRSLPQLVKGQLAHGKQPGKYGKLIILVH